MAALEHLAATAEKRSGIVCQFRCDPNVAVEDNNVATELFLIAKEAVNNAVRHAGARRLELQLRRGRRLITISVRDDGKGLKSVSDQTSGVGLKIMQHRADLIGAILKIQGTAGGGTEVVCSVPRHHASCESDERRTS
jgi:signal transduction histidine kinase